MPTDYLSLKLTCRKLNCLLDAPLGLVLRRCYMRTLLSASDRSFGPPEAWLRVHIPKTLAPPAPKGFTFDPPDISLSDSQWRSAFYDFVQAHSRVEQDLRRKAKKDSSGKTSDIDHLLCTACGSVKPRELFEDKQAKPLSIHSANMYCWRSSLRQLRKCIPCDQHKYARRAYVVVLKQIMFIFSRHAAYHMTSASACICEDPPTKMGVSADNVQKQKIYAILCDMTRQDL